MNAVQDDPAMQRTAASAARPLSSSAGYYRKRHLAAKRNCRANLGGATPPR